MQAIIALGANLGDPCATLQQAVNEIQALDNVQVTAVSSLYRTKPVGYADQDDFINAVITIDTTLPPLELYRHLAALEQKHHRVRLFKNGPRTLDLDVIACEQLQSNDPTLTLPHPRAQERAFVLVPLAEIAPDFVFPDSGLSVASALERISDADKADIVKLSTPALQ